MLFSFLQLIISLVFKKIVIKYHDIKHNLLNILIEYEHKYYKNFLFVKKKNKYYIVDGIINYTFDPIILKCSCSPTLCEHIIYYLTNMIGINIDYLFFSIKLKKIMVILLKNNQIMGYKRNNY